MSELKIILEIKEKSSQSLVFLADGSENAQKSRKEALGKRNISLELLPAIGRLLEKHNLPLDKISGFEIISDVPKKWTSYRIAEITLKSLVLAKKNSL